MYVTSEKAVGTDAGKSTIPTLKHSAGVDAAPEGGLARVLRLANGKKRGSPASGEEGQGPAKRARA